QPGDGLERGSVTVATTVPQIKKFLEAGGTVIAIGSSTALAGHLGLPVRNHLATLNVDGKEQPLGRDKVYVPGSVLRVRVDPSQPLAWGMGEQADVMFAGGSVFRLPEGAGNPGLARVAWFDGKTPLRSGWAWGQENLDGGVAVVDAEVGKGRLVLLG